MKTQIIPRIKGALFDLDGCIYSGNQLYPKAVQLIDFLQGNGVKITFLSNNSTQSAIHIKEKLHRLGLNVQNLDILCVTDLAGEFIKEKFGTSKILVIGTEDLKENVEMAGHKVVEHQAVNLSDIVLVGRDVEFSYDKILLAGIHISHGAKLVATNLDDSHPGEHGELVPETGSLVAAIQMLTKEIPENIGKPNEYSFLKAVSNMGFKPQECLMVGDNLFTDIKGGYNVGVHTCWITHGKENFERVDFQPSIKVNTLEELYESIKEMIL